jgi:hypothetical protein
MSDEEFECIKKRFEDSMRPPPGCACGGRWVLWSSWGKGKRIYKQICDKCGQDKNKKDQK